MEATFINDFAATCEDMELSKARLVFSGSLLLALAMAPAVARAQFGGIGSAGGQGNMMSNLMRGAAQGGQKGQETKSPDQLMQDAKKGMANADPRRHHEALDPAGSVNDPRPQEMRVE